MGTNAVWILLMDMWPRWFICAEYFPAQTLILVTEHVVVRLVVVWTMKWGHWVQAKEIHMQLTNRRTSPGWLQGLTFSYYVYLTLLILFFKHNVYFLVKKMVLEESAQTVFGGVNISLCCSVSEFQARVIGQLFLKASPEPFSSWRTPRCSRAGWENLSPSFYPCPPRNDSYQNWLKMWSGLARFLCSF